jgi:hypothetical protein
MKLSIRTFLVIGLIGMIANSCDFLSSVNLTDQKSIDKLLLANITKHLDPETVVFGINLLTTADFSTSMDIALLTCLLEGNKDVQEVNVPLFGNQKRRDRKKFVSPLDNEVYSAETGIKLKDIDFSKIASNVSQAAEAIKEAGWKLDGIKSYTITFDGNPANTIHQFRILSKVDTKLGSDKGGRAALVTEYLEFKFSADAEGEVTYIEN